MMRRRKTIVGQLANIKAKQRGFTLPLSIGVGISMLLLGSLMIARSNVDQVTAIAQVQSAGALSVAEAGVARTLSQLNSPLYTHLVTQSYDRDRGDGRPYLGPDQTLRSGDNIPANILNQWATNCGGTIPAGLLGDTIGTGTGQGTYTVLAYRYNPDTGMGALLVEGRFRGSTARVQVSVSQRARQAAVAFPGLYASDRVNMGGNDVLKVSSETGSSANIICGNCTTTSTVVYNCTTGRPAAAGATAISDAMGRNAQSIVDGQGIIANLSLPAVPTPPASGTAGRYDDIATITSDMTLPRPVRPGASADVPDANGVYHYVINSIDLNGGGKTLTISPPAGRSVRLYVSGNITLSGNAAFSHTGTPDQFAIFGTASTSQTIKLNGGVTASKVFIYAPNATVGVNGGGGPGTNSIHGAVWAKTWDGSSGNNVDIQVPDNMPTLLRNIFGSTYAITRSSTAPSAPQNWSREGAIR
jgi:hypothetical protein